MKKFFFISLISLIANGTTIYLYSGRFVVCFRISLWLNLREELGFFGTPATHPSAKTICSNQCEIALMVIKASLESGNSVTDFVNSRRHPKVSGLLKCLIKHVCFGYYSINHSLQKSHVFVTCCVCEKLQFFYDQFYTVVQFWQTQLAREKVTRG